MTKDAGYRRRKRLRLFGEQRGLCWYCRHEMTLKHGPTKKLPDNFATFEHLDDRFSDQRGKHPGKKRIVLACYGCNHAMARLSQSVQDIDRLRQQSKRHKSGQQEKPDGVQSEGPAES